MSRVGGTEVVNNMLELDSSQENLVKFSRNPVKGIISNLCYNIQRQII